MTAEMQLIWSIVLGLVFTAVGLRLAHDACKRREPVEYALALAVIGASTIMIGVAAAQLAAT